MRADTEVRRAGRAMGSDTLLVVHAEDADLLDAAQARVADLEQRWSRFLPRSEISILNDSPTVPVIVSPVTYELVATAIDAAVLTGGRFDPTVHDSLVAIGYDRTFAEVTSDRMVGDPVAAPGVSGIHLDDALHAITLPAGVRIDLGGIGKGAAADLVCTELVRQGARGAAVSIGGDTRVIGCSPTGGAWSVTRDGRHLELPPVHDGGICTSSIARRRWASDRHHLVDPATGRPLAATIETITVVAATAAQAEVLTKAAMLHGADAPAYLESCGVTAVIDWGLAA